MIGFAKKKKFAKKPHHKTSALLIILWILVVVPCLALTGFVLTYDIDSNRALIAKALSRRIGREVLLNGPVTWHFAATKGLSLCVREMTVANRGFWPGRPLMARVGKASLFIDLKKAVFGNLDMTALELDDADIQLEISGAGEKNWDFWPEKETDIVERGGTRRQFSTAFHIQDVRLKRSRIGLKNKEGHLILFDIPDLLLREDEAGLHAHYKGTLASLPTEMDIAGGFSKGIGEKVWPFNLQARMASMTVSAQGHINDRANQIALEKISAVSGESHLTGRLNILLDDVRPFLKGVFAGQRFALSDLALHASSSQSSGVLALWSRLMEEREEAGEGRLFSREKLPFDGLNSFDAQIDLSIDSFRGILLPLRSLEAHLSLREGMMTLSPFKGQLAGSEIVGRIDVDANALTPVLLARIHGQGLDFAKILDLGGIEDFLSGKVDLAMDIKTAGRTPHDLAAQANGTIQLLMDSGSLSSGGLKSLGAAVMDFFFPVARSLMSPSVNCMAARYKITNGLLETTGFLLDTETATVAGTGSLNLPDEHINMLFRTRPKNIGVGVVVPPIKIYGDILSPEIAVDFDGALSKAKHFLRGSDEDSGVPEMLSLPGSNACALTLDNPDLAKKLKKKASPLVPGGGTLIHTLKNAGFSLWQELVSEFLGN